MIPATSIFSCVMAPAPRYLLRIVILRRLFKRYVTGTHKSFLEIGPGLGDVSAYLASHPAIASGLVIDRSEKSAAIVGTRLASNPAVKTACADILDIGEGTYDYVCSFEVLEHIEEDVAFMRDVHQRVAAGGYWFISVPAYMKKWQAQDVFSGHVRRYEAEEMRQKLTAAGFAVVRLIDYGFPLTSLMRPFRDRFYKQGDEDRSALEKTLDSGTEKRALGSRSTMPMLFCLLPFVILQDLFAWLRMGDGFIVVARKSAVITSDGTADPA